MIRSMFTAIGSLQLNQIFLDTVADNLANANTYGYKSTRFSFQDQFAQLLNVGSVPTAEKGGVNPTQVGLGSRIGSISSQFVQGSLQNTGRNTDLAIQGEGFFVYKSGDANLFSRDGMMEMDSSGYLVHGATGLRVQGWQADDNGVISSGTIPSDIQIPLGSSMARATANVVMRGNLQANSTGTYDVTIGLYDSLGQPVSTTLHFTPTATPNTWTWTYDNDATQHTLVFDEQGQYVSGSPVTINPTGSPGSAAMNVSIDLSTLTQLAGSNDVTAFSQDGLAAGDLTTFYVSTDNGQVYALYSNGIQQLIGQLAMARFVNPAGLERNGQNMFSAGLNSGEPNIGVANTGGRGVMVAGYLEDSNVNMAQEFTNMILAQRGFQASSRVITTSDEILQELVNLKR